jgi:hypothetical protein
MGGKTEVWITDGVEKDPITGKLSNKIKRRATPEEVHNLGFDNPYRPGGAATLMNQALANTQKAANSGAPGMGPRLNEDKDKPYYYVGPIRQEPGPVSKQMEQDIAFRQWAETAGPEYDKRKQEHQEDLDRAKEETKERSKLDQLKTKLNVPAKDLNNPYRV